MKKLLCVCAVLFLLGGCASTAVPLKTEQATPSTSGGSAAGNPNPIPGLKDVTIGDISGISFWQDGVTDDNMLALGQKQIETVLYGLKLVQLTGQPDEKVKLDPTLKYDVTLGSGETLHIGFAGLYVEFGDGAYTYESCGSTVFPPDIGSISIGDDYNISSYEDEADVTALLGLLALSPCTEAAVYNEAGAALTTNLISKTQPVEAYRIQKTKTAVYVYKQFFTLNTCIGTIGDDAYKQLITAKNGQFGTKRHFAVTSGGETISPPSHSVSSMTYSEEAGGMLFGDSFPRIEDYIDRLETLSLAEDFSVWSDGYFSTWFKVAREGNKVLEDSALTYSALSPLSPGTYTVEVYVSTQGDYIETLKTYEMWTDVYYFQLMIK